ncbi:MAG: c-type cytochrome [Nitrospinae bacterium]|nr:c-type cytochrome [Nitrospinota bacterium]
MKRLAALAAALVLASCADKAAAPVAYAKCKPCHGVPGAGGTKMAPDLLESSYTLEQFTMQAQSGSQWEGKPAKHQSYRTKSMPPRPEVTQEDTDAIFRYVQTFKKR